MLCIGALTAYVFSESLALFAQEPYPQGSAELGNLAAHLTNTCAQRRFAARSSSADSPSDSATDDDAATVDSEQPGHTSDGPACMLLSSQGHCGDSSCSQEHRISMGAQQRSLAALQLGSAAAPSQEVAPGLAHEPLHEHDTCGPAQAGSSAAAAPARACMHDAGGCSDDGPVGPSEEAQCQAGDQRTSVEQADQMVHAVSELPQLLHADGMDLQEAEGRVQQLQGDVHTIIGGCTTTQIIFCPDFGLLLSAVT